MRKTMRLATGWLVALLLVGLWGGCSSESDRVCIGAVFPLSGTAVTVGEAVRDGLALAAEEINGRGGINGRKVELVFEDAAGSDGIPGALSRLERRHPVLVFSCLSSVAASLAPLAETRGLLMVALVAAAPSITQGREWVYRYWPTAEMELPSMEPGLKDERIRKLVVIYLDDEYGRSVREHVAQTMHGLGREVRYLGFQVGETEFDGLAREALGSDAVAIVGFDPHIAGVLKALRRAGYEGRIISTTAASMPTILDIPESEGVWLSSPAINNPNYVFIEKAKKEYESKYNKKFNLYSAGGYDVLNLLAGLMEGRPLTSAGIKAQFDNGFVYSGSFGNVELAAGSHDIHLPLFPARIEGGELRFK